jgi:F-type H+-transporting ATPase subunit epsilon
VSEGENQEGRQLFCRLITPERVLYDGEAELVIARIADGDIGVMVDHAPVVSTVEPREVRIRQDDERYIFATSDGFFKVSENLVHILVEEAVSPDEIDVDEAENRIEQAEQELSELPSEGEEDEDVERQRNEIERRRRTAENLVRVAREYGEG